MYNNLYCMKIIQVDPNKSAPEIFVIVKQAFNRPFDACPKNVSEVTDYIKGSDTYYAYDRDILIGYFVIKHKDNQIEIGSIGIPEKFQSKGYGSAIMDYILKNNPDKKIWLVTHPKNTKALFLYLRKGFEITGWIDNCFGDGQPRLKLEKYPQ